MKLLFDENLSRSLVSRLQDLFPGSNHIVLLGLERASDREILGYAKSHDFVVVTKDSDFNILLSVHPEQPGLIWIRAGNCSTDALERLIREHRAQILGLCNARTVRLLMLF